MTEAKRFFTEEIQKSYCDYIAAENDIDKLMKLQGETLKLAQTFGRLEIDYTAHLGRLIVKKNATPKECRAAGISPKLMRQAVKIYNFKRLTGGGGGA